MSRARLTIRYRFRNGAGKYLCMVLVEGDKCIVGFTDAQRHATNMESIKAARAVATVCHLAGAPVVLDPYETITRKP